MQSNEELGFAPLFGGEIRADGGGTLSINLTIGRRREIYRAYAYQWHCASDASRQRITDQVAARAGDPMTAAKRWRVAALRRGWRGPGVEAAYDDLIEEIAEAAQK